MAQGLIIQPWITIVAANSQVVTQSEAHWPDTRMYQDGAFLLELANSVTNANVSNLDLQSSPTKDNTMFDNASITAGNNYLARWGLSNATAVGVQPIQVCRFASATNQLLAAHLRWKLSANAAGGPTSFTFRIIGIFN